MPSRATRDRESDVRRAGGYLVVAFVSRTPATEQGRGVRSTRRRRTAPRLRPEVRRVTWGLRKDARGSETWNAGAGHSTERGFGSRRRRTLAGGCKIARSSRRCGRLPERASIGSETLLVRVAPSVGLKIMHCRRRCRLQISRVSLRRLVLGRREHYPKRRASLGFADSLRAARSARLTAHSSRVLGDGLNGDCRARPSGTASR